VVWIAERALGIGEAQSANRIFSRRNTLCCCGTGGRAATSALKAEWTAIARDLLDKTRYLSAPMAWLTGEQPPA